MIVKCALLLYSFFKIGIVGFGGGYAMLSMIITESEKFSITAAQSADLNALDMVVPGPIAINAATFVGYYYAGFWGAAAATLGVSLPSFIIISLVSHFLKRFKENKITSAFLSGVKPAAVGLIAAAAITIAKGVLLNPGALLSSVFSDPLSTVSLFLTAVFAATAIANIRFKINPILLTAIAALIGAFVCA